MKDKNNVNTALDAILNSRCTNRNICPVKDIMASYTDKWSMYAILLLGQKKTLRFNQLRSLITGISQRMLTVTLRSLEKDGIVARFISPEIPQKIEYSLTELGQGLFHQLVGLATWAKENVERIMKAREKLERSF
ncbi:MAG TPA: helix-turn-helix domain-containing protein [Segetibacter sp.]|nr:helix-turn-helix domain-containing protein [Segetibacter sp.]